MPAHRTRDTPARSLEVTTDAPQPPTVAIISPTPRVFSFPINDSPSPSPSSSPFDPDVNPFATAFTSTPPANAPSPATSIPRTISPAESVSSDSSTPSAGPSHKRQKSTQSEPTERRPKKGDEGYIKRPENAFILFRRKCCEERKELLHQLEESSGPSRRQRQADLSKLISQQWKSLAPSDRSQWEELAREKKKEHEKMYPDYVYRPQRSKRGKGKGKKGTDDELSQTDGESVPLTLHAPTSLVRGHGRSSSAPTPPPGYGTIQLPTVFMPSCPSSPSLLPMISRRPHRPSLLHQSTTQFDFLQPNDNSLPPSSFYQSENGHYTLGLPSNLKDDLLLPPLTLPHDYQLTSPVDTTASASSGPPSPQHQSPFTPQFIDNALPATSIHEPHPSMHAMPSWMHGSDVDMDMAMHDMQIQYQDSNACWESHGQMSLWPQDVGVGMVDEFEGLGSIPELDLGLGRFEEFNGESSSTAFGHGDVNVNHGQDDLESIFALNNMDLMDASHPHPHSHPHH